jgi:hypothetical protein
MGPRPGAFQQSERASQMPDEELSWAERLSRHGWLIGVVALAAWLALLWFMFGDVL